MTVDDLWRQHESHPRNRLIAQSFFLIKYVEQFGTGIQRIVDDCHAQRLPEPDFEVHGQTFRVIFKPGKIVERAETVPDLNDRQKEALKFIRQHGKIQAGEYRTMGGIGQRQAVKDLNLMVKQGIIVRKGAGRSTTYVLGRRQVHD